MDLLQRKDIDILMYKVCPNCYYKAFQAIMLVFYFVQVNESKSCILNWASETTALGPLCLYVRHEIIYVRHEINFESCWRHNFFWWSQNFSNFWQATSLQANVQTCAH